MNDASRPPQHGTAEGAERPANAPEPVPVDRVDRMVEIPPLDPSSIRLWLLLLTGPVLWITHFMLVYLGAEATCAAVETPFMVFLGADAMTLAIVVVTALAAVGAAVAALWSWGEARTESGDRAILGWAGALLGAGSVVAILAVGLPAVVLELC